MFTFTPANDWTALILALGELDSHILYDYAHAPKEEMFKFMHVT